MTEYATKFEEAIVQRNIVEPDQWKKGDLDPETMNWSSSDYQLPTGDKLGVFKVARTSLYKIGFTEKTADQRRIPAKYTGMYTSPSAAQSDLMVWIRNAFEEVESKTVNRNRRSQSEARKAKEAPTTEAVESTDGADAAN